MTTQPYKDTVNPFWNTKLSVIFLLVISFVIVSGVASSGITNNLDNSIAGFFGSLQDPTLDLIFIIITTTSDTINLIIAGFVLTIIKRTRRFGMILLISLVAITILVTYIKPLFGIEHPQETFVPLISLPEKFTLERDSFMPLAQGYSFPSNHIASAVAFGFIIGGLSYRYSFRFALAFMISFPIIIGFTKLYLFQHNLMDLIGGYLFGLIIVILIVKGLKANIQTPKNFERVQEEEIEVEDDEGGEVKDGGDGVDGAEEEVKEVKQAEKEDEEDEEDEEEKGEILKKKTLGKLQRDKKTPESKMDNDNNKKDNLS
ncbi:phosphatase PAP2 family protein [Candidatus Nitrosocosmicus hydrocola]|uniref:phosphatase PAP2 family protein n=1 Tax=Candidatus Nitrosocosmicus hydrocola TaxID=1826872 RepID=UPI0011E5EE54|nr:phosphatase PAP2 family protein [Candidatus Nitrosocosmicus hydrocola]